VPRNAIFLLTLAPTLLLALTLALTKQGVPRNAISLFLEIDEEGAVARRWHARSRIVNDDATTYDAFDADRTAAPPGSRALLARLSGATEADEMVAWYNPKPNPNPNRSPKPKPNPNPKEADEIVARYNPKPNQMPYP
jgi:hypothetical protein